MSQDGRQVSLDHFDTRDLWRDTALLVTTDHGFLLGEHDFWAKNRMSLYEEIVHIPLFFHHTRLARARQPTEADAHPDDRSCAHFPRHLRTRRTAGMQGISLLPALREEPRTPRAGVIFGYFGGAVNVTDGRFVYNRHPRDLATQVIYRYTLMPQHIWQPFSADELRRAELTPPLPFTKGMPVLQTPVLNTSPMYNNCGPGALLEHETRLYDLETDPGQLDPLQDPQQEARLAALMRASDAPGEAILDSIFIAG